MTVQLELWHLVLLALSVLAGFWTLTKIIASQAQKHLDDRFTVQERARSSNHDQLAKRLDGIEIANREESTQWQRVERELLRFQADMPLHYVRREDYIRGQSVIEAKLDGVADKLEKAQLRAIINGGNHASN